jgi:hypothetical protein
MAWTKLQNTSTSGTSGTSETNIQKSFSRLSLLKATAINDPNDLMSHCIAIEHDSNGWVYGVYYADKTDSTERLSNINTKIYLVKFNIANPSSIERWLVAEVGSVFTNLTQGNNAPYDPNIKVTADKVKIFFLGYEPTGFKIGCVDFDKTTKTMGTTFTVLNMTYNSTNYSMTPGGVKNLCNASGMGLQSTPGFIAFITKFVLRNGYYYTTVYGTGVQGIILKTTDFVNYEVVAFMNENTHTFQYSENAIEFLTNDKIAVICRTDDGYQIKSVYTISTNSWSAWTTLTNVKSKPLFVRANGKLYAFYNTASDRSVMQIDQVDSSGNYTPIYTVTDADTLQYFDYATVGTDTYFSFSNDRKKAGGSKRSTMTFLPIMF